MGGLVHYHSHQTTRSTAIVERLRPHSDSVDKLLAHPDFEKVKTASPEWSRMALERLNNHEK